LAQRVQPGFRNIDGDADQIRGIEKIIRRSSRPSPETMKGEETG
jgi:hypothetical protein